VFDPCHFKLSLTNQVDLIDLVPLFEKLLMFLEFFHLKKGHDALDELEADRLEAVDALKEVDLPLQILLFNLPNYSLVVFEFENGEVAVCQSCNFYSRHPFFISEAFARLESFHSFKRAYLLKLH